MTVSDHSCRPWFHHLAVLAAVAMMLSLLPLASSALAQDPVVDPNDACPGDPPEAPFTDRDAIPDVHVRNVDCAFERGIVEGFTDNTYRPALSVRRDQMASFVFRTLREGGVELPPPDEDRFSDIPPGHTHDEAIHRLKAAGIAQGGPGDLPADRYGPAVSMRRDQLMSFVARGLEFAFPGSVDLDEKRETRFPDVPASNVHSGNIEQTADLNIVQGFTDGTFGPARDTRRDQMASIMVRLLSVLEEPPVGEPETLTLAPETATNTVGSTHEMTATVTDRFGTAVEGADVRFEVYREVVDGGETTLDVVDLPADTDTDATDAAGEAAFSYTSAVPAEDTIVACLTFEDDAAGELCADLTRADPNDAGSPITGVAPRDDRPADSATKTWEAGVDAEVTTLTLDPAAAVNEVNTDHTVTASVADQLDGPVAGQDVRFEVYRSTAGGPAEPVDFTGGPNQVVATDAAGEAVFTYTGPAEAAVDTIIACVGEAGAGAPASCATATGGTPVPVAGQITATATKAWQLADAGTTAMALNPPAAVNEVGTDHTVTASVADVDGPVAARDVRFEVYRSTAGGPAEPVDFTGGPNQVVATDAAGEAVFTYTGPAEAAVDTIIACVDEAGAGAPAACATVTEGVPVPDAGLTTATATKAWQLADPEVTTVTLNPAADVNTVGTEHTVTASVADQFAAPIDAQEVRFEVYRTTGEGVINPVPAESATVSTVEGDAPFAYTGPAEAAVDTIVACVGETGAAAPASCAAVTDGVVVREPGLTTAAATKVWQEAAVTARTVTLGPAADVNLAGTEHTVTASVSDLDGPIEGQQVRFEVYRSTAGGVAELVDVGAEPLVATNAAGQAAFTYTGPAGAAADTIVACIAETGTNAPATCATVVGGLVVPDAGPTTAAATKGWIGVL